MSNSQIKQAVVIETFEKETLWGWIMLPVGDDGSAFRLQDVINDPRKFLPFFVEPANTRGDYEERVLMLHKDAIKSVTERDTLDA